MFVFPFGVRGSAFRVLGGANLELGTANGEPEH
jgi:hypothetical protein